MKYSVIICYRDREEHLRILAPRLREVFGDEAEIIVVEQDDEDRFLRGQLFNVGAKYAKGDILVFHDVDHYPVDVNYEPPEGVDVWLPVKRVTFVDNAKLKELPELLIPSGYRHFKNGVDDDFYGGVEVFRREAFFRINGFNSLYRGWGLEDADIRERIKHFGLAVERGDGDFKALQHKDSFPGSNDEEFQRNQQIFSQWKEFLHAGVATQLETINEVSLGEGMVDRWIKATNIDTVVPEAVPFMTVGGMTDFYEDTPDKHTQIWTVFKALVNETMFLKEHRDWVVQNNHGYGNRALHWMWNLLVKSMPHEWKFLEIGVFKGQTISLVSLLNEVHKKDGLVFGVTPLDETGAPGEHPVDDYEYRIGQIYAQFGLDMNDLMIIEGLSQSETVVNATKGFGPFDIVYIDGGHSYDIVFKDLVNYAPMVRLDGFLVIDDASCDLTIPDGLIRMNWRGIPDVCAALNDWLDTTDDFEHLFAIGHNRVFRRVNENTSL